jgi:hypothetical protein
VTDTSDCIHSAASIEKYFNHLDLRTLSSPMQGRHPVTLSSVHIGSLSQETTDSF